MTHRKIWLSLKRRSLGSLLSLGVSLGVSQALSGAVIVKFTGANGTQSWSDAANWDQGLQPNNLLNTEQSQPSARNSVQFVGTGTSNVDSAWSVHDLVFNSGSQYTLQGSTISIRPIDDHLTSHDSRKLITNNSAQEQVIHNDLVFQLGGAVNASSGNLTFHGQVTLANEANFPGGVSGPGLRLVANSNRVLTFSSSSIISGAGGDSVAFNGSGTIVMAGANTYTRGNSLWNGAVKAMTDSLHGVAGAFGAGTSNLSMGANTTSAANFAPRLLTGEAVTIGRNITLTTRTQGTGLNSFVIGGDSAHTSHYTGTIRTSSNANTASNAFTLTAASNGRVNFTTLLRDSTLDSGNDHLTKTGNGIVALTGTASYAGNTLVQQGTLLVNGVVSKTATGVTSVGSFTVSSAARLGGFGNIGRNVLIQSGAILAPGDRNAAGVESAGTLTVDGNLQIDSSSAILAFNLGSVSDRVSVLGNLTLKGTLNLTDAGGFTAGSYKLFDYTGNLTYNTGDVVFGSLISPSTFSYTLDTTSVANAVYLNVVPEPSRALLLFLAGTALLSIRRRK